MPRAWKSKILTMSLPQAHCSILSTVGIDSEHKTRKLLLNVANKFIDEMSPYGSLSCMQKIKSVCMACSSLSLLLQVLGEPNFSLGKETPWLPSGIVPGP